jgi:5-methylcytosine-specific restriction protein B
MKVLESLKSKKQILLAGPPGTSKSWIADQVTKDKFFKKENVTKLQFHPSFSYEQFIGGQFVEKQDVVFREGVLLQLSKKAQKKPKENFILVIDEINRANVSAVLGEAMQCLDRDFHVTINFPGNTTEFYLPGNLYIIGTYNTADRSLGVLDFAFKRRFYEIYCKPDPDQVMDLCPEKEELDLHLILTSLNESILDHLHNKELLIGHSRFFSSEKLKNKKYHWTWVDFENEFNQSILPTIEEHCYGDQDALKQITGKLCMRLTGEDFKQGILDTFCS